jgi:hypothetical protein
MEVARLEVVALHQERVVAMRGAELDHLDPALERDVEERAEAGVAALDHQQRVRPQRFEDPLAGVDALDPVRERAREVGAHLRVVEVDPRLVARADDGRERLPADPRATVLVRLEVLDGAAARHRGRDLLRGRVRAAHEVLVEDETAEPERAPGPHRAAHGAEREHVDVRAAELEALRKERLEPDLPRAVVQADDEVAPPARPGPAGEVGGEARILVPERLRLAPRVEQRTGIAEV